MPKKIYDWLSISKEYIQGLTIKNAVTGENRHYFPTHTELSEKYNIPVESIRQRSGNEKWGLQRVQFKRKLKLKSSTVNLEDLLGVGVKFDSRHLSALENISILIDNFLKPHIELLNNPEELEMLDDMPRLTIRDLKDITTIIKDSHTTVRSILGDQDTSSLIDDIKLDIIAERKNKEISKNRLIELSKQLNETQMLKEELEMRKKEIQLQLEGSTNDANSETKKKKKIG